MHKKKSEFSLIGQVKNYEFRTPDDDVTSQHDMSHDNLDNIIIADHADILDENNDHITHNDSKHTHQPPSSEDQSFAGKMASIIISATETLSNYISHSLSYEGANSDLAAAAELDYCVYDVEIQKESRAKQMLNSRKNNFEQDFKISHGHGHRITDQNLTSPRIISGKNIFYSNHQNILGKAFEKPMCDSPDAISVLSTASSDDNSIRGQSHKDHDGGNNDLNMNNIEEQHDFIPIPEINAHRTEIARPLRKQLTGPRPMTITSVKK